MNRDEPSDPETVDHEVAERAYLIWEREGRSEGRQLEHWYQAERELTREREPIDAGDAPSRAENTPAPQTQASAGTREPMQRTPKDKSA